MAGLLLGQRQIDVGRSVGHRSPGLRAVEDDPNAKFRWIDVFNCLVESQKIPIFSIRGEPVQPIVGTDRISRADADVRSYFVGSFGSLMSFYFFRDTLKREGVFPRA